MLSLMFLHFNSHAHVERDPWKQSNMVTDKNFNSHAHVERDTGLIRPSNKNYNFNSHAHVERDVEKFTGGLVFEKFQLTRSRGA